MNLQKEIWEGWTVQDFINNLESTIQIIMKERSWKTKFFNKEELKIWLKDNQPYYKKNIPEVIKYFADKYNLK